MTTVTRQCLQKMNLLITGCRGGVHITFNHHKDRQQTVRQFLDDANEHGSVREDYEVDEVVEAGMERFNQVVEVQFYPLSPVGFEAVLHYDLEQALDRALEILANVIVRDGRARG